MKNTSTTFESEIRRYKMKKKERRVEQRWGRVFYKFCLSALFIVLSIGLCLGISPVAHAIVSNVV